MARRALLIANGTFDQADIESLSSPVSDARRLKQLLEREDVGDFQVKLLPDAKIQDVRDALDDFCGQAKPGDEHIIHISGHGFRDETGFLHFAAKDTKRNKLWSTAIKARDLHEISARSLASQTILFIDTCYSGAYFDGYVPKAGDDEISANDLAIANSRNVAVITASSSFQRSWETKIDDDVQSRFTRHLMAGIETGKADRDGGNNIRLRPLFNFIKSQIDDEERSKKSEGEPHPVQNPKSFYFDLNPDAVVVLNPVSQYRTLPPDIFDLIESRDFELRMVGCDRLYGLVVRDADWSKVVVSKLEALADDPDIRVRDVASRHLQVGISIASQNNKIVKLDSHAAVSLFNNLPNKIDIPTSGLNGDGQHSPILEVLFQICMSISISFLSMLTISIIEMGIMGSLESSHIFSGIESLCVTFFYIFGGIFPALLGAAPVFSSKILKSPLALGLCTLAIVFGQMCSAIIASNLDIGYDYSFSFRIAPFVNIFSYICVISAIMYLWRYKYIEILPSFYISNTVSNFLSLVVLGTWMSVFGFDLLALDGRRSGADHMVVIFASYWLILIIILYYSRIYCKIRSS